MAGLRIDHFIHLDPASLDALRLSQTHNTHLLERLLKMATDLKTEIADLTDDVAQLTTVDASAVALLTGLSKQLADAIAAAQAAGATAEQLQQLADLHTAITTQNQALADAVAANTPAPTA
jgi:hypothetical protein